MPIKATPIPADSGRLDAPWGKEAGVEGFPQPAFRFQFVHPCQLLIGDAAACFRHGKVDLALVGGIDVGGCKQTHINRLSDHGRILHDNVAQGHACAAGHHAHRFTHRHGIFRVDVQRFCQCVSYQVRIIRRQQKSRVFRAVVIRVYDFGFKGDGQCNRCLGKGRVAFPGNGKQQGAKEENTHANGQQTENPKPGFGGVAAL